MAFIYNAWEMKDKENSFALITGASQGLGKALALALAQRKHHLLLVALPGEGLPDFALQLAEFQVKVHFFETNLALRENVESLAYTVNRDFAVNILVNNAGRGGTKRFEVATTEYLTGVLELNIVATALLTHLLLPNLQRQRRAFILNVSSMAAFSPIGYKTVYPASKAFIRHWSLGLREELKSTKVSVSVVHPGPMKTNPDVTKRIENQGFKGTLGLLPPEKVAQIALNGMFMGKASIVPGLVNQLNRWLMSLLPDRIKVPLITNAVQREL